jgi:hypothetical protein
MDPAEDAITKLYAAPLDAFTRERNALATALTKAGHADQARAVRQLRRPSAPLWAINQLARADSERLEAFFDSIAQIRKTQLRDPRAAAEAVAQQRRALAHLVRRAREVLASHGGRATRDAERRISDTLLGAAVDRHRADELRHGRLTQELAAPGFEVLTGTGGAGHLQLVRRGQAPRTGDAHPQKNDRENEKNEREKVGRRAELELARRRQRDEAARHREEAAARKRDESARRQREMAERRATVEQADQEAKELSARLAAARQRLAEARRAAKSTATRSRQPVR